ncbi:hypothetical protein BDZ91DRAFT_708666 [Kalaharituber pfeilii]|nr:hypothetical protein BDZ91DRAFT_708666 [Kalaharituber pfeilii]
MALASWKSFPFFNVTRVSPHDDNPKIFEGDIRSLASSNTNLFLGTGDGQVQILSASFKLIRTFPAYSQSSAVSHLQQVDGTSLLVTIGEDLSNEAVLKVWALDQTEKKSGAPKCLSTVTILNGRKRFPVTAMAIPNPTLNPVAVAFANGSLTLIRGDLIHDRGAKQRIVFSSDEPITNLAFYGGPVIHGHHNDDGETRLWISTTTRLLCMHIDGSSGIMGARLGIGGGAVGGSHNDVRIVDAQGGVGVGCMIGIPTKDAATSTMGEVVVVRDDAIYFYSSTGGKGGCYAYEGAKSGVYIYKNYVALISPPQSTPSSGSTGGTLGDAFKKIVGGAVGSSKGDVTNWDVTRFTILDTEGKYIAAQEVVVGSGGAAGVRGVFELGGFLWVLGLDGKLWRYQEKDLTAKLNLLYSRNLYLLAISLASKSPSIEPQRLYSIYRKYADYLYAKQDFDGAMQWYIKALGDGPSADLRRGSKTEGGEVSGVIRKFLDTQRIGNLIEYLEELHKRGAAGVDHTTLLINCYAKGRDVAKLEKFIKSTDNKKEETRFDVDTVIDVCRQGGYYEQAVYLATNAGEDSVVVSILVENLDRYHEALDYLSSLEPSRAYPNLMKYARILLKNAPQETTKFFIEYYTGRYIPKKPVTKTEGNQAPSVTSGGGGGLAQYTSFLPQIPYRPSAFSAATTAVQANAPAPTLGTSTPVSDGAGSQIAEPDAPKYTPPQPRTAFSSFVDNPLEFIEFLESLLQKESEQKQIDKVDIYTTLFEMYLGRAGDSQTKLEKDEWEAKAKRIIQSKENLIDTSNILLLSYLSSFNDGTVLVREKQGLLFDIFRSCTSAGDTQGALQALRKYGAEEPQLYTAALAYFTSSPKVLHEVGEEELKNVLKKIDELGLMKPLQVVQTLSVNAVATVGMVKKYLGETIEKERKEIQTNRRLIESYKQETESKKKEIAELTLKPVTFQAQKCQACRMPLDLPIVHFLCKHSFHQRCLNQVDGEIECPHCQASAETIRAIRRTQDEQADRHDLFKAALAGSTDKFATISEWFGRGVMISPPPVEG